ncbi:immunity protein Imm33 domain-containing protein [Kaistella pullorum]|uniref:Imm33-like domain-containing protein n=1 Tax=Kaistella pullorum TaxID=2763074 RepID=A0ABR8WQ60_9FLAO|nr:hypothetical protein [Kaistella pullorum]MBD8019125.1 hypothetical protein [Kaistella pullorum]
MKITRSDLIKVCDDFIKNKIDKIDVENFASEMIYMDDDFEDEIVAAIIFEWDNEIINYEINEVNVKLWKKWLQTDENKLLEHNSWNVHIEPQKNICEKYNSLWKPINKKFKIGISDNWNENPINGLRHSQQEGTTGWFIWSGEYSDNNDFFKPICAEHLLQIRPEIIKYLGLEIGFRFLVDNKGYEDVWKDENIE